MITKVDSFLSSMSIRASKANKSGKATKSGKSGIKKDVSETSKMKHSYYQKLVKSL